MQHILVCTQDPVLAKKVRFLLAREEREVELLRDANDLSKQLQQQSFSLLVLSRRLQDEDATAHLGRLHGSVSVPPTLILGGGKTTTAEPIHLIPDPVDTQTIYETASRLLDDGSAVEDEGLTHVSLGPPDQQTRTPSQNDTGDAPEGENEVDDSARLRDSSPERKHGFKNFKGLDEIAQRLDSLEAEQLNENLSDAFDIDEASGAYMMQEPRPAAAQPPVLGGMLEPARFAKLLYQCWSKEVTGALIVARESETLTIFFETGAPVQIESSIPGDTLGRALVDRGRITESQYSDGAKRAIEGGTRLGHALVDLGFFSQEELGEELGTTARDRVIGCFEARQGSFEFDPARPATSPQRPYRLRVPHIVAEGLRRHADHNILQQITGDVATRYFKLQRTVGEINETYPLTDEEKRFLAYEGRAYNVSDAAESASLGIEKAHKLMSLLTTFEEITDFTPGVPEFEARIREERALIADLQSGMPKAGSARSTSKDQASGPLHQEVLSSVANNLGPSGGPSPHWMIDSHNEARPSARPQKPLPPPPPLTSVGPAPMPPSHGSNSTRPPSNSTSNDSDTPSSDEIPPMPVPSGEEEGLVPRPLVYAKPLPRNPDGSAIETSERALSREHFQRGVTLLGQGNFANAEEAFRDAVALCAEELVYLIGLARAIYYNPEYQAQGKLPVLKSIIERAEQLAPEDPKVITLRNWVSHAEAQHAA